MRSIISTLLISFILSGIFCLSSCSDEDSVKEEAKVTTINIQATYDELYIDDEIVLNAEVFDQFGDKLNKSVNWTVAGSGNISTTFSPSTKLVADHVGEIEVNAELEGVTTTKTFSVLATDNSEYDYLFPSQLENARITFTWLVLIYEKVDIPANSSRGHGRLEYTLPDNIVDAYVNEIKNFESFTAEYTGGEIGFNMAVAIIDDRNPLTDMYWNDEENKYGWLEANDIIREMDIYVGNETGWFDNIHVFFPGMKEWGPYAAFGGGGYFRDNISRSQYHYFTDDKHDWRVGTWHESIHVLETQYWHDSKRNGTCKRGKAPDGTDIELHGQPSFGYVGNQGPGQPESENYFQWMADLTTGDIRDLTSVGWQNYDSGTNTNLGFGKNGMYEWGPVRNEYEFKPGGPFPQE